MGKRHDNSMNQSDTHVLHRVRGRGFSGIGWLLLACIALCVSAAMWASTSADEPKQTGERSSNTPAVAEPLQAPKLLPVSTIAAPVSEVVDPESRYHSSHPLKPLLATARESLEYVEQHVRDYTCELVKREMVGGKLLPAETIFAKVRHATASRENVGQAQAGKQLTRDSIYLRFQAPEHVAGRELLYIHSDKPEQVLLVRNGGRRLAFLTLEMPVHCALAMRGNRYPVTEFGIKRLIERMIALGERELAYDDCQVNISSATCEGAECQVIEVIHPERRPHFAYHLARVFVDTNLQLPIRFEAYDWPAEEGALPVMVEEYTYRNIQLNVGLSDEDFDRANKDYLFR